MANELNMTLFSKRLKEARTDKNMTQKELSEKSGVSTVMISAYERSNTNSGKNPALNNIYAIATALGVSMDWLCGLTENTTVANDNKDELTMNTFLVSLYRLINSTATVKEQIYPSGYTEDVYNITIFRNRHAFAFIEDCQKLKEALKLDILDDEMKQNLINGVIEKYIKLSNNDIDEFFKEDKLYGMPLDDDLPF